MEARREALEWWEVDDLILQAAALRTESNHLSSTRIWSKQHYVMGMAGEYALCELLGQPFVPAERGGRGKGDEHDALVSVQLPTGDVRPYRIDVKTSRPDREFMDVNKTQAKKGQLIYIFAHYHETEYGPVGRARLVGWQWASYVYSTEARDWYNKNDDRAVCYRVPVSHLRPMYELLSRMVLTRCN